MLAGVAKTRIVPSDVRGDGEEVTVSVDAEPRPVTVIGYAWGVQVPIAPKQVSYT